ncbi:MAG TPA: hypothetical protein VEA63_12905 [Opitutus sp.]|nr:hypothetical protein [Opitutus sp.]
MKVLYALCAVLLLFGCNRTETALSVPPSFYPSAIAYDAARGLHYIGSFANGEIAVVDEAGDRVGTLRAATPGDRVVRLAIEVRERKLWAATSNAIEVFHLDRPDLLRQIYPVGTSMQYADFAVAPHGVVYLLDRSEGLVRRLDTRRAELHTVARLPREAMTGGGVHCSLTGEPGVAHVAGGALALMPGEELLLAAYDERLYRVAIATGEVAQIPLHGPLTYVTQLIHRGTAFGRHEIVAIRGEASRITHLALDADLQRLYRQESFHAASSAPIAAAFDGTHVRMIAGPLRHHPVYCGDGRPTAPLRIIAHAPKPVVSHQVLAMD